uniref:Ig-like domain-containing protein n=1 Tax=Sphenodon punctatus TaxID=8508 RepID=A0A8D0L660_SPHPU
MVRVFTSESRRNVSAGACEVFLTCAAATGTNMTYTWNRTTGGETLSDAKHLLLVAGQVLWTEVDPTDEQVSYTCTVANPVSRDFTTVTPWEHCRREAGAEDAAYDYRNILLIVLPLALLLVAGVALWIGLSKTRSAGTRKMNSLRDLTESDPVPV